MLGFSEEAVIVRWTENVPMNVVLGTVLKQQIFLRIVEVGLKFDSGIAFDKWGPGRSQVNSIILSTSLQYQAFRNL